MDQNNILKIIFLKNTYEHGEFSWCNFRSSHSWIRNIILILKYLMHVYRHKEKTKKKYQNVDDSCELNFISHQENINENHNTIIFYQPKWLKWKRKKIPNFDKDVEQLKFHTLLVRM